MFKQTYDSMNERLVPDRRLIGATLQKMEARRGGRHHAQRPRPRRAMAVAFAALLVVCLSLTAVAAAPQLAQFWQDLTARYGGHVQMVEAPPPIAEASSPGAPAAETGEAEATSNDATAASAPIQVVAAAVDRDNAEIYFSIDGLEGQAGKNILAVGELRVGERAVPVSASPVFFDEETGAAVFCQGIYIPDGIDGSEATLTITGVYSRYGEDDGSDPFKEKFTLDLGKLPLIKDPPTLTYTMPTYMDTLAKSWEARYNTISQEGTVTLLAPSVDQPITGVQGVSLSAAGYVDGKLHVQFHVKDPAYSALLQNSMVCSDPNFEPGLSYSDHAFDTLFNLAEDGPVTDFYDQSIVGREAESVFDAKMGYEYVEIISELPKDALAFWQWGFGLVQTEAVMEGEWQQSFTLSVEGLSMRQNTAPFTVDVETLHMPENFDEGEDFVSTWAPSTFDGLRVTPFGVTVSRPAVAEDETPEIDGILKRFAPDVSKLTITVETAEGTQTCTLVKRGYTIVPDGQGRMSARYLLETPVEPEDITALRVNGIEVPLS